MPPLDSSRRASSPLPPRGSGSFPGPRHPLPYPLPSYATSSSCCPLPRARPGGDILVLRDVAVLARMRQDPGVCLPLVNRRVHRLILLIGIVPFLLPACLLGHRSSPSPSAPVRLRFGSLGIAADL